MLHRDSKAFRDEFFVFIAYVEDNNNSVQVRLPLILMMNEKSMSLDLIEYLCQAASQAKHEALICRLVDQHIKHRRMKY